MPYLGFSLQVTMIAFWVFFRNLLREVENFCVNNVIGVHEKKINGTHDLSTVIFKHNNNIHCENKWEKIQNYFE